MAAAALASAMLIFNWLAELSEIGYILIILKKRPKRSFVRSKKQLKYVFLFAHNETHETKNNDHLLFLVEGGAILKLKWREGGVCRYIKVQKRTDDN